MFWYSPNKGKLLPNFLRPSGGGFIQKEFPTRTAPLAVHFLMHNMRGQPACECKPSTKSVPGLILGVKMGGRKCSHFAPPMGLVFYGTHFMSLFQNGDHWQHFYGDEFRYDITLSRMVRCPRPWRMVFVETATNDVRLHSYFRCMKQYYVRWQHYPKEMLEYMSDGWVKSRIFETFEVRLFYFSQFIFWVTGCDFFFLNRCPLNGPTLRLFLFSASEQEKDFAYRFSHRLLG